MTLTSDVAQGEHSVVPKLTLKSEVIVLGIRSLSVDLRHRIARKRQIIGPDEVRAARRWRRVRKRLKMNSAVRTVAVWSRKQWRCRSKVENVKGRKAGIIEHLRAFDIGVKKTKSTAKAELSRPASQPAERTLARSGRRIGNPQSGRKIVERSAGDCVRNGSEASDLIAREDVARRSARVDLGLGPKRECAQLVVLLIPRLKDFVA